MISAHHAAVSFKFFLPLSRDAYVLDSSETITIPCLELGGKLNFYHLVAENGIDEFCSNSNYVHHKVQTVDRAGE